jgi:tetratricopeptide (TPR) repeat protein
VDAREADSLLELAQRAGEGLQGLDRKAQFAELEGRYDDLAEALRWFVEEDRADEAILVARSLAPFWMATRRLEEGSQLFDQALRTPGGDEVNRGRGCFDAGLLVFWTGDDERSEDLHRQALEIGRRAGDPTVTALALTGLARIALRSDVAAARVLCEEALAVTDGTEDRVGRSSAVHVLGVAAQMSGELVEARELMTERMALARELGNYLAVSSEGGNLSVVERQLGNLDRADELAREALEIARAREDEWMYPYLLNGLAAVAAERGGLERAATLLGAAESMMEAQGAEWPPDERPHYERTLATLEQALTPEELDRALRAGKALAADAGVAYALAP